MNNKPCATDNMYLGFAYVPCQEFKNLYDTDKALKQGTIFKELDISFESYKNNAVMNPFK